MPTITDFSRVQIEYTADNAAALAVPQRAAVATAVGNTPTAASLPGRPSRWKLRCIYLVTPVTGAITNRKRVVIGDPTNPLYVGTDSDIAALDGVGWRVEGRIGEKRISAA